MLISRCDDDNNNCACDWDGGDCCGFHNVYSQCNSYIENRILGKTRPAAASTCCRAKTTSSFMQSLLNLVYWKQPSTTCPTTSSGSLVGQCGAPAHINSTYAAWRKFSAFQQALYLIDETEARWQQLKSAYSAGNLTSLPGPVSFYSINWDSSSAGEIDRAVSAFANFLGISAVSSEAHVRPHTPNTVRATFNMTDAVRLDRQYRRMMHYPVGNMQPFYSDKVCWNSVVCGERCS